MKILIQIALQSDEGATELITDSIPLARGARWQDEISPVLIELRGLPAKLRRAVNEGHDAISTEPACFPFLRKQVCPRYENAGSPSCCPSIATSARITQLQEGLAVSGEIARRSENHIWVVVSQPMRVGLEIQIETNDLLLLCEVQNCQSDNCQLPFSYQVGAIILHSIARSRLDEIRSSFWR